MTYVGDLAAELLAHRKLDGDAENNAIVDAFVLWLGDLFDRVGLVAFGDEEAGVEGGRVLRDPRVAPLWALRHAALYTGAELPGRTTGEADDAYLARARDAAVYPLGLKRGTYEAIRRALRPYLVGDDPTIIISDAYGGPYDIAVRTLTAETPDPVAAERALSGDFVSGGTPGAIRAELRLAYVVADTPTWAEVGAGVHWVDLPADVTWNQVTLEDLT